MIAEALRYADDPNAPRVEGDGGAGAAPRATGGGGDESWGRTIRRVLMTGVSYMIPFVAAGGLLIALASCSAATRSSAPASDIVTEQHACSTCPTSARSASTTRCSTVGFFAYIGADVLHARRRRPSASSSPPWPATSPSRSPTGPASRPGFVMGGWPSTWCIGLRSRLPRRHRRRRPRRLRRAVDHPLEGADLGCAA